MKAILHFLIGTSIFAVFVALAALSLYFIEVAFVHLGWHCFVSCPYDGSPDYIELGICAVAVIFALRCFAYVIRIVGRVVLG